MLKEGVCPLSTLDCDPSSRSLSLKVLAQGTNKTLGRERRIVGCPGNMTVPGFSPLFVTRCRPDQGYKQQNQQKYFNHEIN